MPTLRRAYRINTLIVFMFSALSVPLLLFVLLAAYIKNKESIEVILNADVKRSQHVTKTMVQEFAAPVIGSLNIAQEMARIDPSFFTREESVGVLYQALKSADHIDSIYVVFENGFVRALTSISSERRTYDAEVPKNATVQSFYITAATNSASSKKHDTFYENWPTPIASIERAPTFNYSHSQAYQTVKHSRKLTVSDPFIHPSVKTRMVTIAVPMMADGKFLGALEVNVTISQISDFLSQNRLSPNSLATLFNRDSGAIIAHPTVSDLTDLPTIKQRLEEVHTSNKVTIFDAMRGLEHILANEKDYVLFIDGVESSVSLFDVENQYGLPWRVLLITPLNDFVGPVRQTSSLLLWLIIAVVPLQIILIRKLSHRMARAITRVTGELQAIREMKTDSSPPVQKSTIAREIRELQDGMGLLRSALDSFGKYIPLEVVRQLIESGKPLERSVEYRDLTIMFCDIENFSTLAQRLPAQELLDLLSEFFSAATEAITEEGGTVDKFIGDAVMSFWGAPTDTPQPELRACRAALKTVARLREVNDRALREGKETFRARFGIHSSRVLVGNIGSNERLSYTAIGDGVNIASRIEGINKELSTTICLSDTVYQAVAEQVEARPLRAVSVKGRTGEFMVYELIGLKTAENKAKEAI